MARPSVYVSGLVLLGLLPLARSEDPPEVRIRNGAYSPPPVTLKAQSNLVESAAVVRDSHGQAVGGFTISDFTVLDNGKPQPITVFSELHSSHAAASAGSDATKTAAPLVPRSLAFFFDDLHLNGFGLVKSKAAAQKLIAAGLPPGEQVGIFTDSGKVTVDFTRDTAALLRAVDSIKSHEEPASRGSALCPTLSPYQAFLISENLDPETKRVAVMEVIACDCRSEAHICEVAAEGRVQDLADDLWNSEKHRSKAVLDVLRIVVNHLDKQPGDRVLVMVSGGFPNDGSMKNETSAIIDDALRAHVTINSLGTDGLVTARNQGLRELVLLNIMSDAAEATGGRFVKGTNDLSAALDGLATDPEVSYLLGFQAGEPDGNFHSLSVRMPGHSGFRVEARPGYLAARPVQDGPTTQQRIDGAVLSRARIEDVPAVVRLKPSARPGGGYSVEVVIDVDAKRLAFTSDHGLHLQQLTFVTAIRDDQGNFLTGKEAVMDLRVKNATLAKMQANGIHAVLSFSLPRGSYTVREVVRELVQNRLAALDTPLTLK